MHKNCIACDSQKIKKILHFRGLFVNKCKNCGLFFVEVKEGFKIKKTPELYPENMYDNYWNYESGFYEKHWNEFENHENDILNDLRNEAEYLYKHYKKGKLLDVGCFKGHFCSFMKEKGWETVGVDISKEAIEFGKKKFGINLLYGELDKLKLDKESFDMATMWGVIEHFPNPHVQIKNLNLLLKKGGVLIIKTQNQKSLLTSIALILYKISFGVFNSHLDFFYSREHLCRFDPKSLGRLLESEGFSVKNISFDSAYIFKFAINNAKIHIRMAFKIIGFMSRLINKQDKIIVFAEKK